VADEFAAWVKRVEDRALKAMLQIAREGEEMTRGNRGWQDDTHSAEASITGYVVQHGDPHKNFNDPRWLEAQRSGSSKYPQNKPENYTPVPDEHVQVPDGGHTAVVTSFIKYARNLESDWGLGTLTFHRSFEEAKYQGLQTLIDAFMAM